MSREKKKVIIYQVIAIALIYVSFALLSYLDYHYKSREVFEDTNRVYMQEITRKMSESIDRTLGEAVAYIQNTAFLFSQMDIATHEERMRVLTNAESNGRFDLLRYMYTDGTSYATDGSYIDVKDRVYYQEMMNARPCVSGLIISKFSGKDVIPVSAPVIVDGKVAGGVIGIISNESFQEEFSMEVFDTQCNLQVVSADGEVEIYTQNKPINIFQEIAQGQEDTGNLTEKVKSDFAAGRSGYIRYQTEKGEMLAFYEPISINGWFVYNEIPAELANVSTDSIDDLENLLILKLVGGLLLIALITLLYVYVSHKKIPKEAEYKEEEEEDFGQWDSEDFWE